MLYHLLVVCGRLRDDGLSGGDAMTAKIHAVAFTSSLLITTAVAPAYAVDMTQERALNPQREPQNWILHHANYQSHRF
jgi:hypothetical protein